MELGGREVRNLVGEPAICHFEMRDEALTVQWIGLRGGERRGAEQDGGEDGKRISAVHHNRDYTRESGFGAGFLRY